MVCAPAGIASTLVLLARMKSQHTGSEYGQRAGGGEFVKNQSGDNFYQFEIEREFVSFVEIISHILHNGYFGFFYGRIRIQIHYFQIMESQNI